MFDVVDNKEKVEKVYKKHSYMVLNGKHVVNTRLEDMEAEFKGNLNTFFDKNAPLWREGHA